MNERVGFFLRSIKLLHERLLRAIPCARLADPVRKSNTDLAHIYKRGLATLCVRKQEKVAIVPIKLATNHTALTRIRDEGNRRCGKSAHTTQTYT